MQNNIKKKIKEKIKIDQKKGIVFWVTGFSGVGKTTLSKKILTRLNKKYGPTILINGDDLRKIFGLKKYDHKSRKEYVFQYATLCKFISNQKINVLIAVVGLFNSVRLWNRKNIKNYIEIYIKVNMESIIKKDKRRIYKKKNVFGKDIKAELPRKPHIKIINDFKTKPYIIGDKLFLKIKRLTK